MFTKSWKKEVEAHMHTYRAQSIRLKIKTCNLGPRDMACIRAAATHVHALTGCPAACGQPPGRPQAPWRWARPGARSPPAPPRTCAGSHIFS